MIVSNTVPTTIQGFRTQFAARGFQPINRYKVWFGGNSNPNLPAISFYPETVVLPEISISIMTDEYYTTPRRIPISSEVSLILMSFITSKNWTERIYFENWMNYISYGSTQSVVGLGPTTVVPYNFASDATMTIYFYNQLNGLARTYNYYEVYPQSIANTSFDSRDTGIVSFQVMFHARSRQFGTSL